MSRGRWEQNHTMIENIQTPSMIQRLISEALIGGSNSNHWRLNSKRGKDILAAWESRFYRWVINQIQRKKLSYYANSQQSGRRRIEAVQFMSEKIIFMSFALPLRFEWSKMIGKLSANSWLSAQRVESSELKKSSAVAFSSQQMKNCFRLFYYSFSYAAKKTFPQLSNTFYASITSSPARIEWSEALKNVEYRTSVERSKLDQDSLTHLVRMRAAAATKEKHWGKMVLMTIEAKWKKLNIEEGDGCSFFAWPGWIWTISV